MPKKAVRLGINTNSTEISPIHCYLRREITNRIVLRLRSIIHSVLFIMNKL